ncbi:MAG: hypothetical protein ABIO67_10570 [Mycobacteriales bacterium]
MQDSQEQQTGAHRLVIAAVRSQPDQLQEVSHVLRLRDGSKYLLVADL